MWQCRVVSVAVWSSLPLLSLLGDGWCGVFFVQGLLITTLSRMGILSMPFCFTSNTYKLILVYKITESPLNDQLWVMSCANNVMNDKIWKSGLSLAERWGRRVRDLFQFPSAKVQIKKCNKVANGLFFWKYRKMMI